MCTKEPFLCAVSNIGLNVVCMKPLIVNFALYFDLLCSLVWLCNQLLFVVFCFID